ncbi:MAG TPA: hypothetical protein VH351_10795 [Bryobacteraceae bacterium]|nr:hypothetical protein [Bryobacteraceae bacterium]
MILRGRQLDSATADEIRIAFDSVAAFHHSIQERQSLNPRNLPIARALAGPSHGGLSSRDMYIKQLENAWREPHETAMADAKQARLAATR